ncbi:PAS:GGDEF:EAL:GAF (fragment) [Magnetospirillum sp. LM-5]|uniref:putative bifunctional diguanylate cyclase/phosphodiesterase n=1 Tax=Magnetospirillum sp. LM-5 TaxID=2681466 RepID=UPI001383B2C0
MPALISSLYLLAGLGGMAVFAEPVPMAASGWLVASAAFMFLLLKHVMLRGDTLAASRARRLQRSAATSLDTMMVTLGDGLALTDSAGIIRHVNPAFSRLFGYPPADAIGEPLEGLLAAPHADQLRERLRAHNSDATSGFLNGRLEVVARRQDGTAFPAELSLSEMEQDAERGFVVLFHDITARKKAATRLYVAEKVLECTKEGVMVTDRRGTMLWVNHAFCTISGYERDEVLGANAGLLKSGLQGPEFYKAMWNAIREQGEWEGEIWNRRKNGEAYPEWLSIRAIADDSGQITRYVGVFSDISRNKQAEETIRTLTYIDPVTALPNRHLFTDRLSQALERAPRAGTLTALVMIGLDRFKQINETLGHQTGDLVLRAVADRLGAALRTEDTIARLRGDTFCCLLSDLDAIHDIHPVLGRLRASFDTAFEAAGQEIFVSAAFGITLAPADGTEPDDLVRKAETAMNRSKEGAERLYQFYTPEMHAHSVERLGIETELRRAIERGQLEVHYQAKAKSCGTITGAEALLRWTHPVFGRVPPTQFIPIAEENGLIVTIGAWVLQQVCRQMVQWKQEGLAPVKIAVNLSAHQLHQADLAERIQAMVGEHGVDPSLLELEVTESAVMSHAERAIATLETLHRAGFSVAIDDFGTGYSSLSYLKKFPVDTLKIDRSFVHDIDVNPASSEIVAAIVALSHSLKLTVVAEGVETAAQLACLNAIGCDLIQGYHFARPVEPASFADSLRLGRLPGGLPAVGTV